MVKINKNKAKAALMTKNTTADTDETTCGWPKMVEKNKKIIEFTKFKR